MKLRMLFCLVLVGMLAATGCATGPEVQARLDWLKIQMREAKKDGARLCAPYTYAHARAETEFTELELSQGQHVRAEWHMKRAVRWAKLVRAEIEPFRQRKELWRCRGEKKPKPKPRPRPRPRKIDPCSVDKDSDGIPDCRDLCKEQPEDYQGYEDMDGCPDGSRDRDGDGIPDWRDKCPLEPEDRNGFQDEDGCPDAEIDTDGDKVPDYKDKCPLKPGSPPNGCPIVVVKKKFKLIVVTEKKIELKQKVFFATARAKIKSRSFPLLREVASALSSSKRLYVCIEGHTDSRGKRPYNMGLSQRRARSVRRFLINEGIDPARMKPRGYGPDHPIDTNRTRSGRARNRRVEFNIIKRNQKCPRDK